MHLFQALLLWLFISGFSIAGALAFHRLFPLESPWFGFLLPPLGLVISINFIEHFVPLPNLLFLFPVLAGLAIWLLRKPDPSWRKLILPGGIFLGAFAFAYAVRCLQPEILPTSDGLSDLNKINNFLQGNVLPPIDTWLPPFHYVWYYSLQHYGASIVRRLFDVKIGVAYNASHALLSALTCVAAAAAAHRFSGERLWITIVMPFLIESAATGTSAYIHLSMHDPSMWYADNPSGGVIDYDQAKAAGAQANDNGRDLLANPFWQWLAQDPYRERLELQPPGYWTWREEFHANMAGHFLTLLAVFLVAELALARRSLWPWIMAPLTPALAIDASTWAYPITLLLCGGAVIIAPCCGRRPASWRAPLLILLGASILLWPSIYDVTSSPQVPDIIPTDPAWRAPWREFLAQWWPIIALWICGCALFRELSFGARWILLIVPLMLVGVELVTVEGRYNTVEKMWGYTYGAALVTFFSVVASRRQIGFRIVAGVLILSSAISLSAWARNTLRWRPGPNIVNHLEGNGYLLGNDQKLRLYHVMEQVTRATFLSGKSVWCYNESPAPATFTGNRSYSAWFYFESVANYADEAEFRSKQNNAFYAGTLADPLKFLHDNNVTGVVVWPDDVIPDATLATMEKRLAPDYEYIDCKAGGANNAGVFLLRPLPESVRLR